MQTNQQAQSATGKEWREWCGVLGGLFAPVLLAFVWLWAANKGRWYNQFFVLLIPFIGPAIGYAATFLLPMRWYWRVALFLLYMPLQTFAIYVAEISYVCGGSSTWTGTNVGCP